MKQRLSKKMLLNIKTCKNGWFNFSENLNHGIKITLVNLICIAKPINLLQFCMVFGSVQLCCDRGRFSIYSPFIKSMIIANKQLCIWG